LGTGRATADLLIQNKRISALNPSRPAKVVKVVIDNNHTIIINVPDKLPSFNEDDASCGIVQNSTN